MDVGRPGSLSACTTEAMHVTMEFGPGDGRVVLVDTPGFDSPNMTDCQVLEKIASYLLTQ